MRSRIWTALLTIGTLLLAGCGPAPEVPATYDPESLRFDGSRAYAIEAEFVGAFPNRHSGTENNRRAARWLYDRLNALGWTCRFDDWVVTLYSQSVPARNLICVLPGQSPQEILVMAHHDQAPMTIQGADNDGSGVAILVHLAEIFGSEGRPRYTLVFVSSDVEEYGMSGSRRYIQTHPDTENIIAGFSIDNLGKKWYTAMKLDGQGQLKGYGDLWLRVAVQEAARKPGDLVEAIIYDPITQILDQAAPISGMDQGPMVAGGVPALGFARLCPDEHSADCQRTYHTPADTLDLQDPDVLHQSGRIVEASVRQLLSMDTFPSESGPFLYFENSKRVLRGPPLTLIFIAFVAVFWLGSLLSAGGSIVEMSASWSAAWPHFLSLWAPLIFSILVLYGLTDLGLIPDFELYPATAKDPLWYSPRWLAIAIFILGLAAALIVARRIAAGWQSRAGPATFRQRRSFALLILGLAYLYILILNPFSLALTLPTLFWLLIRGRSGALRLLDIILFLLGGLALFGGIYFLGFIVWEMSFYVFWYLMMMLAIPNISFFSTAVIMGILAAGLSLIVRPPEAQPRPLHRRESAPEAI